MMLILLLAVVKATFLNLNTLTYGKLQGEGDLYTLHIPADLSGYLTVSVVILGSLERVMLMASKDAIPTMQLTEAGIFTDADWADFNSWALKRNQLSLLIESEKLEGNLNVAIMRAYSKEPLRYSIIATTKGNLHVAKLECPSNCSNHGNCIDGRCKCNSNRGDIDCKVKLARANDNSVSNFQLVKDTSQFVTIICEDDIRVEIQKSAGQLQFWTGDDNLSSSSLPNQYDYKQAFVMKQDKSSATFKLSCRNGLLIAIQSNEDSLVRIFWDTATSIEMKFIAWAIIGTSSAIVAIWVIILILKHETRSEAEETAKTLDPIDIEKHNPEIEFSNCQMEASTCSVCLEDLHGDSIVRVLKCRHVYHRDCIDVWLRTHSTCCLCKRNLVANLDNTQDIEATHSLEVVE